MYQVRNPFTRQQRKLKLVMAGTFLLKSPLTLIIVYFLLPAFTPLIVITRLDTLVNNAASGILNASLAEQMAQAFQTNATGPLVMAETFVPLLQKSSSTHRIINVTSGAGSIGMRLNSSSPSYNMEVMPYRSSKAALNMIGACLVAKYPDFKIFTYCPGFCVSNLSDMNTAANGAKPTSEGSAPIVPMVNGERDAEAGRYLHSTGEYPW